MTSRKKIPRLKTDKEIAAFWDTHDFTEFDDPTAPDVPQNVMGGDSQLTGSTLQAVGDGSRTDVQSKHGLHQVCQTLLGDVVCAIQVTQPTMYPPLLFRLRRRHRRVAAGFPGLARLCFQIGNFLSQLQDHVPHLFTDQVFGHRRFFVHAPIFTRATVDFREHFSFV